MKSRKTFLRGLFCLVLVVSLMSSASVGGVSPVTAEVTDRTRLELTTQASASVAWNCPLGGYPLIAPNPGAGRPFLTVPAVCTDITVSAGAELWGIYYLVEVGPDAGTWLWYIPGFVTSTLTQLEPGKYYLVVVSAPCVLTVNFAGLYSIQTIYTASEGMFQIHSGDIDGDGLPEANILRNTSGSWFVDYKDGDYTVSGVLHSGSCVFGDVADTDGDGRAEIIAGAYSSIQIVSCIAPDIFQIDATIPIGGGVRGVIAGDIRNDGSTRIIAGSSSSGHVHVFKYHEGDYVEEWNGVVVPNSEIIPTAAGDVDNDGQTEFLINVWETPGYYPSNGNIYVYKWTGMTYEPVLVQHTDAGGHMAAAIADLDRDGKNELVINTGVVSVYKYSSQTHKFEHIWSAPDGNLIQIAIGDVDGDGQDEAVCFFPWSTPGKITVIGYNGTKYNVEANITDFSSDGLGGGTVADFDGDGQNEIITSLCNVVAPEYPIFLVEYAPPTP